MPMPTMPVSLWHWIFWMVRVPIMLTKKLFWLSELVRAVELGLSEPAM